MTGVRVLRLATAAAVALAMGATAVHARPKVRAVERLTATATDPDARGRARLVLKSDGDGRLRIAVRGLTRDASYDVVIDGVRVAALATNGGGAGRVRFSTDPRGRDVLLGVDPRGKTVVIRDAAGTDVLAGTIDDGVDDPAAVACCFARADDDDSSDDGSDDEDGEDAGKADTRRHDGDDHGGKSGKCLDLTPEQCTSEGGTVAAADSCIPDPCGDVAEVICCLPHASPDGAFLRDDDGRDDDGSSDDDGECNVGCKGTTATECAEAGGTVVEADSCHPNPCEPVPPADVVACCLADEGKGSICQEVNAESCEALGGRITEFERCEGDPCSEGEPDED